MRLSWLHDAGVGAAPQGLARGAAGDRACTPWPPSCSARTTSCCCSACRSLSQRSSGPASPPRPEQHGYRRGHDQIEQKRARRLARRGGGGGGWPGSATWRPPWMSMEFLQVCDDFGVLWSFRASCVSVFMLRQWPAHGTAKATVSCLEEAAQLLKFWADALLVVAAALLVPMSLAAVRLLHEQARFLH